MSGEVQDIIVTVTTDTERQQAIQVIAFNKSVWVPRSVVTGRRSTPTKGREVFTVKCWWVEKTFDS